MRMPAPESRDRTAQALTPPSLLWTGQVDGCLDHRAKSSLRNAIETRQTDPQAPGPFQTLGVRETGQLSRFAHDSGAESLRSNGALNPIRLGTYDIETAQRERKRTPTVSPTAP